MTEFPRMDCPRCGGPDTADMRRRVLVAGLPLWEPLVGPVVTPNPDGSCTEAWEV